MAQRGATQVVAVTKINCFSVTFHILRKILNAIARYSL